MAPWSADAVITSLIAVYFCLTNAIIIGAVVRKRLQRSGGFKTIEVTDFYILTIASADCLFGFLLFTTLAAVDGDFRGAEDTAACTVSFINFNVPTMVSLTHLVALAYSRHVIIRGNGHGISFRKAVIISIVLWVICLSFGVTGVSNHTSSTSGLFCRRESSVTTGIIVLITIFAPCILIFWFYYKVLQHVKKETADNKVPRRVIRMVLALSLVYTICLFPYGFTGLYQVARGEFIPPVWDAVTGIIAILNFCANPILYCKYQKKYRNAVFELTGISHVIDQYSSASQSISGGNLIDPRKSFTSGPSGAAGQQPSPRAATSQAKSSRCPSTCSMTAYDREYTNTATRTAVLKTARSCSTLSLCDQIDTGTASAIPTHEAATTVTIPTPRTIAHYPQGKSPFADTPAPTEQ